MYSVLSSDLGNLSFLSNVKSRSICAENFTGGKGAGAMCEPADGISKNAARDLGKGWKVNPAVNLKAHETFELAKIEGPGTIKHIWLTPTNGKWRNLIFRIYWDNETLPSVECPVGDFFAAGWQQYIQISSLAVCVNPASGLNCYWTMPFKKHCRVTVENRDDADIGVCYQIDYLLTEVPDNCAYFHAQWRRTNPLPYKSVYTILDGVQGKGHYVGTYLAWGMNNNSWWEGEIKFYLDGDGEYPTICGTGTEDYFCGSYAFVDPDTNDRYVSFSTLYTGFHEIKRDRLYKSKKRFGMYRWHITDPVRFEKDLRVTIQALGCREKGYLPLQDDIASVAFWYQTLPTAPFPVLPDKDYLEII